ACAVLSLLVLIINLTAIVIAIRSDSTNVGTSILLRGSCSLVSNTNIAAHVVLNILGTLLLGASSYAMQVAIAPTRQDIDEAHRVRHWLDIGVPSFRNLRRVSRSRAVCWTLLLLSSLPLHLIYNSSILASQVANEYLVTELDESFLHSGTSTELLVFHNILQDASKWDNLTLESCANAYSDPTMTSYRTLVLIVQPESGKETLPGLFRTVAGKTWMCNQPPGVVAPDGADSNGLSSFSCNPSRAAFGQRRNGSKRNWQKPNNPRYCLAEPVEEDCKLELSIPFVATVCVANVVKIAVILLLSFNMRSSSLNTFGDAIASFLERPDDSTVGFCQHDAESLKQAWTSYQQPTPVPWHIRRRRQFSALSLPRILLSSLVFIVSLITTATLLALAIRADSARGTLSSTFTTAAFTSKDHFSIIGFESMANATLPGLVLLVNTPQLLISFLYFLYNALLTCFLQAREWNSFSLRRQRLRVSKPRDGQRATYWLQIPPHYAVPMVLFSVSMHWLISQSIFLSKVQFLDFLGRPSERFGAGGYGNMYGEYPGEVLAAGYSSMGIAVSLALGVVAVVVLVGVGARRLEGDMVVVGSCSAGIAAACH
ncbi:hypothetical protein K402DRAFT_307201, partial [Aulographum hederae CBS 113979]